MLALGTAAGCAADRYAGVDLHPGAASADLQMLARDARKGDKQAQFALAVRYELGQGVGRDLSRALKLYRRAAKASGGDGWIYLSSTSSGARAQLIRVSRPLQQGLPEATAKLRDLEAARRR